MAYQRIVSSGAVYKGKTGMWLYIFHRITGVALFGYLLLHIISTALIPCRPAPELITEDMVMSMRQGSVIVDMAAGNGGNCRLSKPNEVIRKHGVFIIGHTNYPSMMPTDASSFFAKNISNLLSIMIDSSSDILKIKNLDDDEITSSAQIKIT